MSTIIAVYPLRVQLRQYGSVSPWSSLNSFPNPELLTAQKEPTWSPIRYRSTSLRTAANATLALKAPPNTRRFLLILDAPDSGAVPSEFTPYHPVQFLGSTSGIADRFRL